MHKKVMVKEGREESKLCLEAEPETKRDEKNGLKSLERNR